MFLPSSLNTSFIKLLVSSQAQRWTLKWENMEFRVRDRLPRMIHLLHHMNKQPPSSLLYKMNPHACYPLGWLWGDDNSLEMKWSLEIVMLCTCVLLYFLGRPEQEAEKNRVLLKSITPEMQGLPACGVYGRTFKDGALALLQRQHSCSSHTPNSLQAKNGVAVYTETS